MAPTRHPVHPGLYVSQEGKFSSTTYLRGEDGAKARERVPESG